MRTEPGAAAFTPSCQGERQRRVRQLLQQQPVAFGRPPIRAVEMFGQLRDESGKPVSKRATVRIEHAAFTSPEQPAVEQAEGKDGAGARSHADTATHLTRYANMMQALAPRTMERREDGAMFRSVIDVREAGYRNSVIRPHTSMGVMRVTDAGHASSESSRRSAARQSRRSSSTTTTTTRNSSSSSSSSSTTAASRRSVRTRSTAARSRQSVGSMTASSAHGQSVGTARTGRGSVRSGKRSRASASSLSSCSAATASSRPISAPETRRSREEAEQLMQHRWTASVYEEHPMLAQVLRPKTIQRIPGLANTPREGVWSPTPRTAVMQQRSLDLNRRVLPAYISGPTPEPHSRSEYRFQEQEDQLVHQAKVHHLQKGPQSEWLEQMALHALHNRKERRGLNLMEG